MIDKNGVGWMSYVVAGRGENFGRYVSCADPKLALEVAHDMIQRGCSEVTITIKKNPHYAENE